MTKRCNDPIPQSTDDDGQVFLIPRTPARIFALRRDDDVVAQSRNNIDALIISGCGMLAGDFSRYLEDVLIDGSSADYVFPFVVDILGYARKTSIPFPKIDGDPRLPDASDMIEQQIIYVAFPVLPKAVPEPIVSDQASNVRRVAKERFYFREIIIFGKREAGAITS